MTIPEVLGPLADTHDGKMPPLFDRLSDYVPYHAEKRPHRPALVSPTRTVDWGALPTQIDRLAAALVTNGVNRGARVGVWLPPTVDGILVFLACARIGALFVGINPKYQFDEVNHIVSDARPELVLAASQTRDRDFRPELARLRADHRELRVVDLEPDDPGPSGLSSFVAEGAALTLGRIAELAREVQPSDPITIVYTSGTTGKPKGALLTQQGFGHNYWRTFSERFMDWLKVPAFFTINHQAGIGDVCALAVVAGGTQYFMQRFDPEELVDLIERERLTYLPGLVTHFQLLLRDVDVSQRDLSSIDYIWWGGAMIPLDLLAKLQAICPRASTDFGQTETHGPLIHTPIDARDEDKSCTIGKLVDPNAVRIADEQGVVCPVGEPGEIQAHGTQTSPGYWDNPDASRALYTPDGWLRTGDLASVREDGYVEMVGRISEMFKSGGYNVYPAEIEAVLGAVPAVDMVVVVSVPDEMYQEVGVAFVTAKAGQRIDANDLIAHARDHLANYKVPKKLFVCRELPRTIVGKIDKVTLKGMVTGAAPGLDEIVEDDG